MKGLPRKEIVYVSFMLFSMFFGAGNLIFPPFLGQSAGESVWLSLAGFVLSAVGLPILAVMAVAKAGSFERLGGRVHPVFASWFPVIIFLSIAPGLGVPRAGSLAYEMGVRQFLPVEMAEHPVSLLLYTLVFFGVVYALSLSPLKLVDRFGKLLTPLLLTMIAVIFVKSLFTDLGALGEPRGEYAAHPVFQGILDGYLTMDAIGALVFGMVLTTALRSRGIEGDKALSAAMVYVSIGAGALLTTVYLIIGYLGAQSASLGAAENGAQILSVMMNYLFGSGGTLLLGVVFTLACLCVSIGLVTSASQFFAGRFTRLSYRAWVGIFCLVSLTVANVGLTQILKVSVPILGVIYPVAILLVVFGLLDRAGKWAAPVYAATLGCAGVYSLLDVMGVGSLASMPLQEQGIGWLVPALLGLAAGWVWSKFGAKKTDSVQKHGVY
ncbi:branched-chain amino acid transport system II carrier protein [Tumebacillus sp. DT12]|uniref:Branched-chain amino acid transport system carrier protein n=1 Tax=Tumebacillus lacus TaxID=2995335 RepID=A0ABT3X2H9_9BACL|nr:branched-chain amino acid transport system II carrier protein [Tumebacillus lacus]MCX7568924.1 branched-chain amino acid transport system II carrier protein [Tumebacillus lacus]